LDNGSFHSSNGPLSESDHINNKVHNLRLLQILRFCGKMYDKKHQN